MQNQPNGLERTINHFANVLSATGAIFLLPLIAQHVRLPAQSFLYSQLDGEIAYLGAWAVVILLTISSYLGASALLQVIIQGLFRRSVSSHKHPF